MNRLVPPEKSIRVNGHEYVLKKGGVGEGGRGRLVEWVVVPLCMATYGYFAYMTLASPKRMVEVGLSENWKYHINFLMILLPFAYLDKTLIEYNQYLDKHRGEYLKEYRVLMHAIQRVFEACTVITAEVYYERAFSLDLRRPFGLTGG